LQKNAELDNTEEIMKEDVKQKVYDDITEPWEFVLKASERYKREFRKTAKIGVPPKIDDIVEKTVLGVEEEEIEEVVEESEEEQAEE
jgi:hypothetical protein